jgi:hypothetical protein
MTGTPDTPPRSSDRPAARLKIGTLTLGGPVLSIVSLLLLALLVALLVWSRPSIGMWLAGGVWLGFVVFWSRSAARRGPSRTEESPRSRATHQNLLNLGLLLLFVSSPGLRWRWIPPNPWHVPVGLGIMAAATLLHVWARAHLGRNWSSEVMIQSDHQLVRTGPYRLVRHPIYTAILGARDRNGRGVGTRRQLGGRADVRVGLRSQAAPRGEVAGRDVRHDLGGLPQALVGAGPRRVLRQVAPDAPRPRLLHFRATTGRTRRRGPTQTLAQ